MPKARQRWATTMPTRPKPITPSVLPFNCVPAWRLRSSSQKPDLRLLCAAITLRLSTSIKVIASSPAAMALTPGVLVTMIPRSVAVSRSIPLRLAPTRPITRRTGAQSSSGLSMTTSSRAISAWAVASFSRRAVTLAGLTDWTSTSSAARSSAMP